MTKSLAEPLSQLQQTARRIAEISEECKLPLDPDEYVESFKPFSMDITYEWSKVQQLFTLTIAANAMSPHASACWLLSASRTHQVQKLKTSLHRIILAVSTFAFEKLLSATATSCQLPG